MGARGSFPKGRGGNGIERENFFLSKRFVVLSGKVRTTNRATRDQKGDSRRFTGSNKKVVFCEITLRDVVFTARQERRERKGNRQKMNFSYSRELKRDAILAVTIGFKRGDSACTTKRVGGATG